MDKKTEKPTGAELLGKRKFYRDHPEAAKRDYDKKRNDELAPMATLKAAKQ